MSPQAQATFAKPGSADAPVEGSLEAIIRAHTGLADVAALCQAPSDEDLAALVRALTEKFGTAIKAVLLYGSYTRGARDSLVDLYVLLDGHPPALPRWQAIANKLLPPNVYQLEAETGVRCKYALLPLRQFVRRLDRDFHSYFWARFAQPCTVVYVSDTVAAERVLAGLAAGARRFFVEASVGSVGAEIDSNSPAAAQALVTRGLTLTYGCELRAESSVRANELVAANASYFDALGGAWIREQRLREQKLREHSQLAGDREVQKLFLGAARWPLRKVLGKWLSLLRLVKAAATFNDGFDYLLWKIERHSGIYIEPTPSQRKLPLLFGWPLFWQLYRLGAFK